MTYKIADDGNAVVSSFGITVGDQVATWAYGPGHPTGMLVSNFVAKASNPATGGGASGTAGSATSSAQITVASGLVSAIKDVPITVTGGGTGGGITIQGGNLARPANEADLRSLLTGHANTGGGLSFDGMTPTIMISNTITVNLADIGDDGCGFNFNGLRVQSAGGLGTRPLIEFVASGFAHRYLSISGLSMFGAYPNRDSGGLLVRTTAGGQIVYATFREISGSWMTGPSIRFQGDVFESSAYALSAKDGGGNGIEFSNIEGIISNFMLYGGNYSRAQGYGMALLDGANSVDVFGGSFVLNGLGGISASNGIRSVWGANGENTGESFLSGSFGGYQSTITGCNLSSNGRQTNGAPNSKPSRYLIMGQPRGSLVVQNCFFTPYTENTQPAPTNMAIFGP